MSTDRTLSPDEEAVMRVTFKATMLRCADLIDGITASDVLDAQAELLATGSTLEQAARLDRATLASAHLRACALKGKG